MEYEINEAELSCWKGLKLFKAHFSEYLVSRLTRDELKQWEPHFIKALGGDDRGIVKGWKKIRRRKNGVDPIKLIDFSHMSEIACQEENEILFKNEFGEHTRHLGNWLDELKTFRNKFAHFFDEDKQSFGEISAIWMNMDRIAQFIHNIDLQNGLNDLKNKKNSKAEIESVLDDLSIQKDELLQLERENYQLIKLTKKQRRWLMAIGSLLVLAIAILFLPFGSSKIEKESEKQGFTQTDSRTLKKKNIITPAEEEEIIAHKEQPEKGLTATITNPPTETSNKHISYNDLKKEKSLIDPKVFVNEIAEKVDVAVLIIDNKNNPVNSLSSNLANLYQNNTGKTITTSLFTSEFLESKYLKEIFNANSQLIQKLNLSSKTKYIVVGRYTSDFEAGEITKYLCRASLDVVIISCDQKSRIDGFQIEASNPYDDKGHAERGAKEKILDEYQREHLKL